MTTPAALGERALRRLGVAVVPVADRPALSAQVPAATIASRALQSLGVLIASPSPTPNIAAVGNIAYKALMFLGVIAAEETAAALDLTLAQDTVLAIHDGLLARGIAGWQSNVIPLNVLEEYVRLTALHISTSFGKTADPAQIPIIEARIHAVTLGLLQQSEAVARVSIVHDSLVSQGFVSWAITAIPQAVSDDYAVLTAMHIAPLFGGKPADPAMVAATEARIRKVALVMGAPALAEQTVMSVHAELAARGKTRWTSFDIPAEAESPYMLLAAYELAPAFGMQANQLDLATANRMIAQIIALPSSGERVVAEYF